MITKNDCLLLLTEIQDKGINTNDMTRKLFNEPEIDMEVIKFINKYRELELNKFYYKLRKNYNNKKSKLYKEIVQIDQKQPKDIIVTLSSLLTQILLFSNEVDDKQMFLKHSRAEEISKVLLNYFKNFDSKLCTQMLLIIKADIKALESMTK